jgi:UDP-N-acetylmuramoyl-L-alanyl-D-glutamate--2,6-diaminopimelate ligase
MGKVATEIADLSIFTAEDPRRENLDKIFSQMTSEINDKERYKIIKDRLEAIKHAISLAKKGDTIAILGKGHEGSMNFNGTEIPWSDHKAVNSILNT